MIFWLASYPKSGNTMLRAIFSSYFHSLDGEFAFDYLNHIPQFPDLKSFQKINVDTQNKKEVVQNYIKAQKIYVKNKNLQFLKTHSILENKEMNFTNKINSLGAIYIVRDPRNVVLSYSHHYNRSLEESVQRILDQNNYLLAKDGSVPFHYIGSWKTNLLSWKKLKDRCYVVKYEDLVFKKKETVVKLLNFIEKLAKKYIDKKIKITANQKRLDKVIESTSFDNLKKLEDQKGFIENPNKSNNKKFFNLGINSNWESSLDFAKKALIENSFEKEMKELGYL